MLQHARLVFHEGLWYFRIDDDRSTTRTWADRDSALAELASRGWRVTGSYPRGFGAALRSRLGIRGYSLVRNVRCPGDLWKA